MCGTKNCFANVDDICSYRNLFRVLSLTCSRSDDDPLSDDRSPMACDLCSHASPHRSWSWSWSWKFPSLVHVMKLHCLLPQCQGPGEHGAEGGGELCVCAWVCACVLLCVWMGWLDVCVHHYRHVSSVAVWVHLQGVLQVKTHVFINIELLF